MDVTILGSLDSGQARLGINLTYDQGVFLA